MATVEVVLPSMCNGAEIGVGISIPISDRRMPDRTDMISGFFESLLETCFIPSNFVDFSSLYNSRIVREAGTLTMEIEAEVNVARCSPSIGKANVMKGMPKKAKLPKIVLKVKR